MKQVIIIPGTASSKEVFFARDIPPMCRGWYPWVLKELLKYDIIAQVLNMPSPWIPESRYSKWAEVFESFILNKEAVVIGHSSGTAFILQYLSENPDVKIKKLILVAPWTDLEQTDSSDNYAPVYTPDKNIANQVEQMEMFYSTDDTVGVNASAEKLITLFGDKIIVHKFTDRGHFWTGDKVSDFPELIDVIKQDFAKPL
jgi:predicted alpha/beta hydrolase family esterase